MAIEARDPDPERERLELHRTMIQKRIARAAEKKRAAERDIEVGLDDLEAADARLAAWDAANPDPQGALL